MPAFWLVLFAIILLPCLCFLVLCFSDHCSSPPGVPDRNVRLPALRPAGTAAPRDRPAPGTGGPASRLRPGDDALPAIRPTGVLLLRSAGQAPHLTGKVADVAFRGRGYEYAINLPASAG